jgi:hypothetical protein
MHEYCQYVSPRYFLFCSYSVFLPVYILATALKQYACIVVEFWGVTCIFIHSPVFLIAWVIVNLVIDMLTFRCVMSLSVEQYAVSVCVAVLVGTVTYLLLLELCHALCVIWTPYSFSQEQWYHSINHQHKCFHVYLSSFCILLCFVCLRFLWPSFSHKLCKGVS